MEKEAGMRLVKHIFILCVSLPTVQRHKNKVPVNHCVKNRFVPCCIEGERETGCPAEQENVQKSTGNVLETTAAPALVVTAKDWRPRPPVRAGSPPQCVGAPGRCQQRGRRA